jgi:hypothetical protein
MDAPKWGRGHGSMHRLAENRGLPSGRCRDAARGAALTTKPRWSEHYMRSGRGFLKLKRFLRAAAALIIYLALSALFFGRAVAHDSSASYIGSGADPTLIMWALVWWPHALLHGLNPFFTPNLWYPPGYNMAWATGLPGPALLWYPVTRWLGPLAAYNALCVAGPALAAWSAWLMCRYMARSFWVALFGGYLFGFSSFIIGQTLAHEFVVLIFTIPLALLLVIRRIDRTISRTSFVMLLAAALTFLFLTSTEIFATATLFGAMALLIAMWLWHERMRSVLYPVGVELGFAYALTAVVVSPYLYYALAFGEPAPINSAWWFANDLLGFFVPTRVTLVGHRLAAPIAEHFAANLYENGAYLGLPLIVLIVLYARAHWRERLCQLLIVSLVLIAICSLGPRLLIAGRLTVPLPWQVFTWLPLLDQALPGRFSVFTSLIAAIMAALWLDDPQTPAAAKQGLAALCVVTLLPNFQLFAMGEPVDTPAFFSSGMHRDYIRPDENVIVLPYGPQGNSMLWNAQCGLCFRMAGGYIGPKPFGFMRWGITMRSLYDRNSYGGFSEELKPFLAAHGIEAIVVGPPKPDEWRPFLSPLGIEPVEVGGVLLYKIPASMLASYPAPDPLLIEQRGNLERYSSMITAANEYLAHGYPLDELTPLRAEKLGLLPFEAPNTREDLVRGRQPAGPWQGNTWLGPRNGDSVGVGLLGYYESLQTIVTKYRPCADRIRFPYPWKLSGVPHANQWGQLLIDFNREELACAARLGAHR